MFTEVCTSTISRLVVSIVDFKRPSTSYVRHLSHRSMNEPEKYYKSFGNIYHICDKRTKRWVGRMENCFCICKQPCCLLCAQIGKNYPRCNSHYPIMGHAKIKNNITVSPDKWIYE